MPCSNPTSRHQAKRKLRPLVISILPPPDNDDDNSRKRRSSRHDQITRMFTTHPSLSAHFE
eukprot:CAMPEP_0201738086 /NCGR_PEP_ID=MMETSP0593-20130828/44097_1 /ASSEMBLY_ACC=CAM_ASM_000672 /TAXON_ID=267983 /ORGANISM="Skeletonema japonicum, Strain CCMP2506" /LENGTH=60 /DNA_ID=CAMNT_0048232205 /DNA_START=15 /DNA_END=194 /DNA_ORIENTATION=+